MELLKYAGIAAVLVAACTVDFSKYERIQGAGATGAGATGGGSVTTGGGGGECTLGEEQSCYSGPAGTAGVGICIEGTRTCDEASSFGACEGEVTPLAEDCATTLDDNCDGNVNEPPCPCEPGTAFNCYDGPAGTEGVGTCLPGQALCQNDSTLGPCVGAVVPVVDDCGSAADEDCSGTANDHCGVWSAVFPSAGSDRPFGLALTTNDEIVLTGEMFTSLTIGGDVLASAGDRDLFVAMLTATGDPLWARSYGSPMEQEGRAVAIDDAGDIYVVGYHDDAFSIGAFPLGNSGSDDAFVAKLSATGTVLWANAYGGIGNDQFYAVASDGSDIYIAGRFAETVDFGLGPVSTSDGNLDGVLLKIDAAGNTLWVRPIGGDLSDSARAVVSHGSDVFVGGWFDEVLDLGQGPPINDLGGDDGFVAKYDLAGAHQWSAVFPSTANSDVLYLAADPGGDVYALGELDADVNFGGGAIPTLGMEDSYVVRLDGTNGAILNSHVIAGTEEQASQSIAVDGDGDVWVSVGTNGETDFGGQSTFSTGPESTISLAAFTPQLDLICLRQFGDTNDQDPRRLAADSAGDVILTADCEGTVDFGPGPFTTSNDDICVTKIVR